MLLSRARPIITDDQCIVAVLGGQGNNKDFAAAVKSATAVCAEMAPRVRLSHDERHAHSSPSVTGGLGLANEGEPVRVS
jgi:hypothetical protein